MKISSTLRTSDFLQSPSRYSRANVKNRRFRKASDGFSLVTSQTQIPRPAKIVFCRPAFVNSRLSVDSCGEFHPPTLAQETSLLALETSLLALETSLRTLETSLRTLETSLRTLETSLRITARDVDFRESKR